MKRFFLYYFTWMLTFFLGIMAVSMLTPDRCGGLLYITPEVESAPVADALTKPKPRLNETCGRPHSPEKALLK